MEDVISLRTESTKTYDLGGRRRGLECHIGLLHYRDNYANPTEPWKDIDLTWEGNRITKAPYELALEGNKVTLRDKKSGEVSTIELLEVGANAIPATAWRLKKGLASAPIAPHTDLEIVIENSAVRFSRILKDDTAPTEAKFRVTGNMRFLTRARDADDALPVEATLVDGILTEKLKPDRPIKYPVKIDPTWQVTVGTDDCDRRKHGTNPNWWYTNATSMLAGYNNPDNKDCGGASRFLNVTIPPGWEITLANLILIAAGTKDTTVVNTRLRAEANVNPATFSTVEDFDARVWTTAVDWNAIPTWTLNGTYTSPDIKAIIQEVIDLPGWASGNPIVVLWDDFDARSTQAVGKFRYAKTYDTVPSSPAHLYVEYTEPVLPTVVGGLNPALLEVMSPDI